MATGITEVHVINCYMCRINDRVMEVGAGVNAYIDSLTLDYRGYTGSAQPLRLIGNNTVRIKGLMVLRAGAIKPTAYARNNSTSAPVTIFIEGESADEVMTSLVDTAGGAVTINRSRGSEAVPSLAGAATLSDTVTKMNELLTKLRAAGLVNP